MIKIRAVARFFKKKLFFVGLLLIILLGLFLYRSKANKSQDAPTLINPQYQDLVKTLDLTGTVDAKKKARLRFLAGGKIVYLGAQEGDWVKQWQTIASIDQRDLQKRLEKSLNLYMQQRWDWEEIQDDIKDRTLDTSERRSVDQNQWTLENSVIDVELQDIAISQAHMSAPFAGILVFSPVSTAYTQVTSADYFELIDPDSLILRAEVNEEDVPLIELGQTATIELDAYPKDSIQTQLSYIAYQSNLTASGTVYAIELPIALDTIKMQYGEGISLLNRFRLGMNGDVKIVLEKKNNVLTVPLICIKMSDDQYLVEIMTKDGKVVDQPVEIGLETDELVEIVSGLTTADQVVLPSLK